MRDGHHGAGELRQEALKPGDRGSVEVVLNGRERGRGANKGRGWKERAGSIKPLPTLFALVFTLSVELRMSRVQWAVGTAGDQAKGRPQASTSSFHRQIQTCLK